ncbi:MAG: lipoprotein insertase outer membrane protein LolB [Syntrophobacteraceae bacterium]
MHSSISRLSSIFLFLLLLLTLATGCAESPLPAGKAPGPPSQRISAADQIAQMKQRSEFWKNFQSKVHVDVNGTTAKFSSPALILVKSSDFVRFETFTPIGMTAALFVLNPTGPSLLIPSQNKLYTAQSPEILVRRFLGGVNLPVAIFSRLLSATISPEQLKNIQILKNGGLLRLISKSPTRYIEWQIRSGALERVFIGTSQFEGQVSYDPPVQLAQESTPQKIDISSKDWRMRIKVQQMQPAPTFQPGVFHLPALPGVQKIELE